MPLSRRANSRVTANIWPGFVDAVTSLLMVMTFVLTIFIVVQYVLREEISGQKSQLDRLTSQVSGLTDMLGLADAEVDRLEAETADQSTLISTLQTRTEDQAGRIAAFEDRVASLLADRDRAQTRIAGLEDERATLVSDQEALNLALAQAREEIDAEAEAARLAAARADALEAMTATLRADAAAQDNALTALQDALSAEEQARMAEAAAAESLRARLQSSDAELTAMTLALEEQRRDAEETLTLLAAARAAEDDLTARLTAALLAQEESAADLDTLRTAQEDLELRLEEVQDQAEARSTAEQEAERTQALLQAALRRNEDQTAEMAAISDALDAAKAARLTFQGDLEQARAAVAEAEAEVAELRAQVGAEADERDQLAAALDAARSEVSALQSASDAESTLRDQLEQALALQLQAESLASERLTEAQRQAALLATARTELSETEAASAEDQRRIEALNGQVAELRQQISNLNATLDLSAEEDAESGAQIENLGRKLNAALAQQAIEQRRVAELEAAERERLERYQSEFFGRLRDVLGDREGVKIVGDRFVFDSEVLFPSGSANLAPAGRDQVARVARLLEDVADDIPETIDWVIRVDGHTDDVPLSGTGEFRDNWQLSQARALSVVRFMADGLGFPEWRLAPTGFGEYRPVDPRRTPDARARNRRIELKLTER